MHLPEPTPDNRVETTFAPDGAGTRLTRRITLPHAGTRAQMPATGMDAGRDAGREAGYARLDDLLARRAWPAEPGPQSLAR